jgi:hypothetical protein
LRMEDRGQERAISYPFRSFLTRRLSFEKRPGSRERGKA